MALWFGWAGFLFALVFLMTTNGPFAGANCPGTLWNWFLPTVLPMASLIAGVMFSGTLAAGRSVDRSRFRWAFGLSIFYLLVVTSLLVLQYSPAAIGLFDQSSLYLPELHGIVAASLGLFFTATK
jgi:hypothetical protein